MNAIRPARRGAPDGAPSPHPIMGFDAADIVGIERAIAAAVAPAFLLNGIVALLGVLAGRIGRLIDRERAIREGRSEAIPGERGVLARRARTINRAILFLVVAALLLCALIVWSFAGGALNLPVAWVMAALLVASMVALVIGLLFFLAEIRIASRHLPLEETPRDG